MEKFLKNAPVILLTILIASIPLYAWSLPPQVKSKYSSSTAITIDAVWFAVQTMTTTGYGSLPEGTWDSYKLKCLSILLMCSIVPIWTMFLSIIANVLSTRK